MCLQIIYLIYMQKQDLAKITKNGWYAIKPNQTKPNQTHYYYSTYLREEKQCHKKIKKQMIVYVIRITTNQKPWR